ncbi:hypothetical protein BDZ45DRAFT_637908 [Acephala macrosclerotiorum]|nr:hypothetical protein BDZ45DRAFT_637908 [Acephala macrosclerotiorum]
MFCNSQDSRNYSNIFSSTAYGLKMFRPCFKRPSLMQLISALVRSWLFAGHLAHNRLSSRKRLTEARIAGNILLKPIKRRLIEQQGGGKSKFTLEERTQRNTRTSLGELNSCGYEISVRARWKDLTILGGALFGSGRMPLPQSQGFGSNAVLNVPSVSLLQPQLRVCHRTSILIKHPTTSTTQGMPIRYAFLRACHQTV